MRKGITGREKERAKPENCLLFLQLNEGIVRGALITTANNAVPLILLKQLKI